MEDKKKGEENSPKKIKEELEQKLEQLPPVEAERILRELLDRFSSGE